MSTFSFQEYAQYRAADFTFEQIDDPIAAAEKRYAEAEGRAFGRRNARQLRPSRLTRKTRIAQVALTFTGFRANTHKNFKPVSPHRLRANELFAVGDEVHRRLFQYLAQGIVERRSAFAAPIEPIHVGRRTPVNFFIWL